MKKADVPRTVYESLINTFGQEAGTKPVGYVWTQRLTEIVDAVGAGNIQELKAGRRLKDKAESEVIATPVPNVMTRERIVGEKIKVRYDKDSMSMRLPWDKINRQLSESGLHDLPVSKVTVRHNPGDRIIEQVVEILNEAVGMDPDYNGYFEGPVYVTLKAGPPGSPEVRERVRDNHESDWFADMGWNVRVLYLDEIHSHNGWIDRELVPETDIEDSLSMGKLESLAINHKPGDLREYGAINARSVVNAWRDEFGPSMTAYRDSEWTHREEWE